MNKIFTLYKKTSFFQKILIFLTSFFLFLSIISKFISPQFQSSETINGDMPFIQIAQIDYERYDKNLNFLNSMDNLKNYFLKKVAEEKLSDIEIIEYANDLLRDRFLHGNTYIEYSDNWFLYVFLFFWDNENIGLYTSSLLPDDILLSEKAICNQQAIIFQKLMKASDIEYKSILFNIPSPNNPNLNSFGHFASAAKVNDEWYFIDTNIEPKYNINDPTITPGLLDGNIKLFNSLYPSFSQKIIPKGSIYEKSKNENPAKLGQFLHVITNFLSSFGWLIFLVMFLITGLLKTKKT
tara:strand:- start:2978 stop:3862 length:885 start_codon:yes stop_codon:yes gene_type:complete